MSNDKKQNKLYNIQLTENEVKIIENYRKLSPMGKASIEYLIKNYLRWHKE